MRLFFGGVKTYHVSTLKRTFVWDQTTGVGLFQGLRYKTPCNGPWLSSSISTGLRSLSLGVTLDQFLSGEIIASNILYKSSNKLKFVYLNAGKFNLEKKNLLISALIQCHFDYTCSAWYNGLSKKLKCRMQCTQNKIIRLCGGSTFSIKHWPEIFKRFYIFDFFSTKFNFSWQEDGGRYSVLLLLTRSPLFSIAFLHNSSCSSASSHACVFT